MKVSSMRFAVTAFPSLLGLCLVPFFSSMSCFFASAHAQEARTVQEADVLAYLEQVIAWHHSVYDFDQPTESAREVLQKEKLKQNSKSVLQRSFTFARAQSDILTDSAPASAPAVKGPDTRQGRLAKATADANKQASDIQAQLAQAKGDPQERTRLEGRLKLVRAQQDLLRTMTGIYNTEGEHAGTLADQISAIYRTAMGGAQEQPALAKEDASAKTAPVKEIPQDNSGMFNLSAELFSLSRKREALDKLAQQTGSLTAENKSLIDMTRASLRAALAQGNAMESDEPGKNKSKDEDKDDDDEKLEDLILHYKQLGAAIIPLGEISILMDSAQQNLQEWNRLVTLNWNGVLHQLVLRLAVLTVSISIPLVVSGLAQRATNRYVTDPKRRLQLRTVRRVLLGAVLTLVILANFLTEFGSLAMFAGFITAGLAVALQTVLVSLVAHFLYFGRYGIRAGDRVTISDVTGEVLQVGMMRLYLRQLRETDQGWQSTDRIVAFPNSILFQPNAFYKHIPKE